MRAGLGLIAALIMILLLSVYGAHAEGAREFEYDVALRGGTLYVGGNALSGVGDLALLGDRIVAVGEAPGRALREIDASGLVVAPGFIDLHTHTDEIYQTLGRLPLPGSTHANLNYLTQGVTTIVTGNCGSGFAGPEEITSWLDRIDALPFGSNVIHLIPHGDLRLQVMGGLQADRPDPRPTPQELQRMRELVDSGMRAGAWGLSTGLAYDPGARAETDEIIELMRVVAQHGGIYASHTRHEGPDPEQMLDSYAEAITIGERSGARAHISHIKARGAKVHGMSAKVIELVETARARGQRVTADQYPYIASSTALSSIVPVHMRDGSKVLDRYCNGADRPELLEAVADQFSEYLPPEDIMVSVFPWKWWLQGKTVAEIARERGDDPVDVAVELACDWYGAAIYFNMSEDDVRAFMTRDWVATGSDGSVMLPLLGRFAHPRLYGTFTRKLRRYVYEEDVVALAFALRSMTELPAEIFAIPERGRLESGYFADVVAFDPVKVRDVATFEESGRESDGIEYLFVNGVPSIESGEFTGRRAGRALRWAPQVGLPGRAVLR